MIHRLQTERWVKILAYLYKNEKSSYSDLSNRIDTFFSHVHQIVNIMQTEGLVSLNKKGRTVWITLTPKGKKVAKPCYELIEECKNAKL